MTNIFVLSSTCSSPVLSYRYCVLVTPEGHSCLRQHSPDKAPFVAQHVQDAPVPLQSGRCVPVWNSHWFSHRSSARTPIPFLPPEGHFFMGYCWWLCLRVENLHKVEKYALICVYAKPRWQALEHSLGDFTLKLENIWPKCSESV